MRTFRVVFFERRQHPQDALLAFDDPRPVALVSQALSFPECAIACEMITEKHCHLKPRILGDCAELERLAQTRLLAIAPDPGCGCFQCSVFTTKPVSTKHAAGEQAATAPNPETEPLLTGPLPIRSAQPPASARICLEVLLGLAWLLVDAAMHWLLPSRSAAPRQKRAIVREEECRGK